MLVAIIAFRVPFGAVKNTFNWSEFVRVPYLNKSEISRHHKQIITQLLTSAKPASHLSVCLEYVLAINPPHP